MPDLCQLRRFVPGDLLRHLSDAVRPEYVCHLQQHLRDLPHPMRSSHVSRYVPDLRDPVQPGDLRHVRDAVQPGDMCDLPDPVRSADLPDVRDLWRGLHERGVHARDLLQYVRTLLMRA